MKLYNKILNNLQRVHTSQLPVQKLPNLLPSSDLGPIGFSTCGHRGQMVCPWSEPHRIMIDKIIFKFCVAVLILYSDYIDIKMPKAKSTWRVRKYFFINGNL